jgi:hypothetical protein
LPVPDRPKKTAASSGRHGVVGRAMHRHHALAGKDVVQQREDRLLVLARIFGVGDQDQLLLEVQRDHRVCAAAVPFGIGLEARAVDDRELGYEGVKLRALGTAQQVADEEVVPRQFADNTHVEAMLGIGAAVEILHEVFPALHVFQHVGMQAIKGVWRHGRVVFPPDLVLDGRRADHELVLRRAAGEFARRDEERATLAQPPFATAQRGFDQGRLKKVVVNGAEARHPRVFKGLIGVNASIRHAGCSLVPKGPTQSKMSKPPVQAYRPAMAGV